MTPYQLDVVSRACDHVQRLCREGRTLEASNHLERLAAWIDAGATDPVEWAATVPGVDE